MRNFLFVCFFGFASAFSLFSCGMHDLFSELNPQNARVVEALKEALVLGSKTAALNLGNASCTSSAVEARNCATGYLGNKLVEIALPDTIKNVLGKINSFTNSVPPSLKESISSLGKYGDSIKIALNRGADQAAPASLDVFRDAIYGMSFKNANEILNGNSTAATSYLQLTTYDNLQAAFKPIIEIPLKLLNPEKYWSVISYGYNSFASAYSTGGFDKSKLPYASLPSDISEHLAEYATGKALDGLFLMVGKQETSLRADPWGTVSGVGGLISDATGELLGDVFSNAQKSK
jgi:hypothetical protein